MPQPAVPKVMAAGFDNANNYEVPQAKPAPNVVPAKPVMPDAKPIMPDAKPVMPEPAVMPEPPVKQPPPQAMPQPAVPKVMAAPKAMAEQYVPKAAWGRDVAQNAAEGVAVQPQDRERVRSPRRDAAADGRTNGAKDEKQEDDDAKKKPEEKDKDDGDECSICFEPNDVTSVKYFACTDRFHHACLLQYAVSFEVSRMRHPDARVRMQKFPCPNCRETSCVLPDNHPFKE